MRKILLTLLALLSLGGNEAWAKTQLAYNTLTTGVDYVLADNGQSWFLAQSGKTGCIIENNKYQLVAADVAGQYYLKQTSTGQYIATAGTGNASWTSDQASAEKFTINKRDNDYQVRFVASSNGYFLNSASTSSNVCPKWSTGTGDWSYWYVYAYADVYADFVATLPQLTTDLSSPKYYSIKSYNRGGYLTSNGAGQGMTHVGFADGSAWYFTAVDGNTSGNVTGGVIAHCSDGTQMTTGWQTAATGGTIYILQNNVNGNGLSVSKTATISSWSCCDASNSNTGVGDWNPSANDWEGTTWVIEPTVPNGYYYFKGMDSGRNPYLYSNFVSKGENATYHHSPLAGTNGEIWKVTNNGGTLTAINGEGLPVTTSSQSASPYTLTSFESLTIGSVAVGPDYYFTEAINLTNWGNDTRLTTWAGHPDATDNRWTFEPADVSAGVYSVVIEGSNDGYVTYNSQNAKNGGFFVAASIAVGDLTAHPIDGYNNTISVEGNTITVRYEYQATVEYSLNGGTYTGTYPGIAGTTVPEFTGCVGYTLTDGSWSGSTYSATINFPFAVSTPTFIGQFHNKNLYNSKDFLWHANGTSVVVHSGDLPDETSDEQNKYLWEIEPVIDGLNITFKIKNVYTGTYINSTTTEDSHSGAVALSETATPVTYNNPDGTGTCPTIYAFYLPSTSKYLSVNSVTGGPNSQLGVFGTVHDGISVGFHTYADLIDSYWSNNGIAANIAKAGQCGYPATNESNYSYLAYVKGALERGIYEGTAENFSNLVTWYKGFLAVADVVKPEVGKFYKFKSANNRYIHAVTPGNIMQMNADGSSADAIFYIPYTGRFLSYTKGYAMTGRTIYNGYYNSGGYSTYTIDHYAGHALGTIRIKGGNFLFDYSGSTDIYDSGTGTDANRCWTVEEVTSLPVSISAAGYATLYAPVALTIPSGVTAYTATDNGKYLTLTAIDGGIIPAETGVILKGKEGSYDFEITTTDATVSSALTGTVAAIARPNGSYILATGTEGIAFYQDGASTIPGFRAYLTGTSIKGFKEFRFGTEDAINAIAADGKAEFFDLSGRQVSKPARGLYIVNGKKVIVK